MKQKLLKLTLLLCTLIVGGNTWAEEKTSTLTFTEQCKGSGTADDGVAWTVTSDGTESNFDNDRGIHYGTNKVAVQYIKLSTSDIQGTITQVIVNASTASGVTATVGVTVGGETFGEEAKTLSTTATNYGFNGSAEGEIVVTVTKPESAAKALYVKSVAVTYTTGGGDTPALKENDLALTGAPIALSFDLYNNHKAQVIQYTTSSTGEVSVEAGANDVSCSVDGTNKTITVTPIAVTNAQTVTVNQAADGTYKAGSVTFTVTVTNSTPIVTHTATFSVNGETTSKDYQEGADIEFPAAPQDVSGKTFVGWAAAAIDGTTDEAPEFVTSATMGDSDVTFYAVFAYADGGGSSEVTDVLDRELTGVTGTSYTDWSGKTSISDAVYAGQSAGSNNSIQLRSNNNNSGIVTTTSGGKAKKVVVTWNSNTADGRTIYVYGKNQAYSSASELYNDATAGDLLAEVAKGTTEVTVTDDYEYIGIRSKSGALYLDEVQITWQTGGDVTYSEYCTTVVAAAVERPVITVAENPFLFSTTATITCATEGAAIQYSFDGENWSNYTDALTIAETTTIYAKATKGNDESAVAQVTATKNLAEPTVTIVATGITNTNVHEGTAAGSLSATVAYNDNAVEGATVTWSSDDEDVATIAENGAVTLVGAGTVTFTATFAGDDDYSEATATYEMTVTNTDPNAPGTEDNPYTVAEAIEATPASGTSDKVYIQGIVSAFYNTSIVGDGSNYRYYISDDGTTENQLLVYKGKGLNNETFSSADDLKIGDEVVIYGGLTTYSNAPEVASGNYIVSLNRPVDTTPSIDLSTTTVNATAEGLDGTIEVTYNNITEVMAEVKFYDETGAEAAYEWIVADINSETNNVDYVIDENASTEARTAYMKVYALDNDAKEVYSELITVTQTGISVDYATLPFAFNGKKDDIENTNGLTQNGLGSNYNSAPYLKFDGTGDYLILKINERPGKLSFDIKGNNFSEGTFTVQTSEDGETYTDLKKYIDLDDTESKSFYGLGENVRYIKWIYTNKGKGNVALGNIAVAEYEESIPLTLNASGFATFASTEALDFSDFETAGYTAWQATSTDGETIKFEQIKTAVAAGTGILLSGEAGAAIELNAASEGEDLTGTNLLMGFTVATEVADGEYFGLSGDEFVKVKAGTVPAGKALLPASVGTSVKSFSFAFEGNATGIKSLSDSPLQGETIVNLAGQRLQKMQKGINIVNGKKVLY